MKHLFFVSLILVLIFSCVQSEKETNLSRYDLSDPPTHEHNRHNPGAALLGAELYFLGKNNCANCHLPEKGYTAAGRISCGTGCEETPNGNRLPLTEAADFPPVSSLSSVGNVWKKQTLWSGAAGQEGDFVEGSKEYFNYYGMPGCFTQILIAADSSGHSMTVELKDSILARWDYFKPMFQKMYPTVLEDKLLDEISIAMAIDAFQDDMLNPVNSVFQKYVRGEGDLTPNQLRGFKIVQRSCENFDGKGCHVPPLFESANFYNLGFLDLITEHQRGDDIANRGRFNITKDSADLGAFRAVQLVQSATFDKYGHGGNIPRLETAIMMHNRKQKLFDLNKREINYVKAFLETLTDSTLLVKPTFEHEHK